MNHLARDFFGLENFFNTNGFVAPAEVVEKDSHFVLTVDMPGVAKSDVKIEFKDETLTVTGERKREEGNRTFFRTFHLGIPVDSDKIEANYQDGVLTILVPKPEAAKPRLIAVN